MDFRLLELATAGLVLLMIWMSSSLFTRLFEPIPVADAEFGPIFSALNKSFLWPQPDPLEEEVPEDEDERKDYFRRKQKREKQAQTWSPFDWRNDQRAVWLVRGAAAILLLGAFVPVGRVASQGLGDLNFGRPSFSRQMVDAIANEGSFPAQLEAGWKLAGFDRIQRSPRSNFGEYSIVWNYALGDKRFSASVDFPFLGWHDPVAQRELQGWTVESEKAAVQDDWFWCEAELENELGGRAYAIYGLFSRGGLPYSRLPPRLASGLDEVEEALELIQEQSTTQVTFQFQVFIESGERLSLADQERLRKAFLELRDIAKNLPSQKAPSVARSEGATSTQADSDEVVN